MHIYQAITVIEDIDLNESPSLNLPTNATDFKIVCCFKTRPISISVVLHRGGFVPGHRITCDITINNQSYRDVLCPTLRLVEYLEFRSVGKIRKVKREVCSVNLDKMVKTNSREVFENVGFPVPSITPTSRSMENVVESNYTFELVVKTVGLSFSKKIQIPVVIGSRPFDNIAPRDQENSLTSMALDNFTAKPSHFLVLARENMPTDHPLRGRVVQSNAGAYCPQYLNYN